jgi:hypothetical protein
LSPSPCPDHKFFVPDLLIGFGFTARSGKDYATKLVQKWYPEAQRIAFADELKRDLEPLITARFGFSAFTEKDEEKTLIRPILVAYGEAMRAKDPNYWIRRAMLTMKSSMVVISDVR